MMRPLRPVAATVLLAAHLLTACATTRPQPVAPPNLPRVVVPAVACASYTRCYQTGPDTYLLQTGRQVFRPKSGGGPSIELLGAAHIGEPAYYADLQQRMDRADAVLYELVTDERRPVDRLTPAESAKQLADSAYFKLAGLLGLSSQKECLRYDRKHFHRCDMTLQQMRALLEAEIAHGGTEAAEAKRALSGFSSLSEVLRGRSWLVNFGFWAVNHSPGLKARLKLNLVVSTPSAGEDHSLPPRLGTLIKEDRNAYVLRELPKFIASHPGVRHLVVFYGFAHLPGLAQGLLERGYQAAGPVTWLTVARCHPQADGIDLGWIQKVIQKAGKTEK